MSLSLISTAQLALKSLILSVALFIAVNGHYPPVFAQKAAMTVHQSSIKDTQQDGDISAIKQRLEAQDDAIKIMQSTVNKLSADVSTEQGEAQGIGIVLTILTIVGIFLQLVKPKAQQ